ncbi:type II toxin-antitoxin system RelE/ParE family toxin [Rubneribacter sp.]
MKPREILLLDDAVRDLCAIHDHVRRASESRRVAESHLKKIRHHLRPLAYSAAAYPRFFHQSGKDSGYRFCIVGNHVAFFTFDDDHMYIKRVLHKRMQADDSLLA